MDKQYFRMLSTNSWSTTFSVLLLPELFTYWDNKFSSTSEVKTCRKKERTTMVTAELNIKISKMSELFSVRSFQYFYFQISSSSYSALHRAYCFILIRHFSLLFLFATNLLTEEKPVYVYVTVVLLLPVGMF